MIRFKGVLLALVMFGLMAGWAHAGDVEEEVERILAKYEKRFEKFKDDLRRDLMNALRGRKEVRPTPTPARGGKPYLGVDVEPVKEGLRVLLNLGKGEGMVVKRVVEGGPCDRAGVKKWDILLSFGGTKVGSKEALKELLSDYRGGQRVDLRVLRDGERMTLRLAIGSRGGGAAPPPREGVEEFVDETLRGDRAKIRRNLKALIEGDVQDRMRARRYFENLLSRAGSKRSRLFKEIERTAEELLGRLSPADRDEMRKMFRKMLGGFEHVVKRSGRESQTKEDIEKFLEEMLGGKKKKEPAKDDIDKLLDELLGKDAKKGGGKKPGPKKTEEDDELPVHIPPKWDKAMEDILGKDGWDRIKKMMKDPQYKEMLKQFFPEGFEFTPANVRKLLDQYGIDMESLPDRLREMGVEEDAIERILKLLESTEEPKAKTKGWMGIRAKDADDGEGVVVTKVEPGGPGIPAGLRADDVIVKIGRKKVRTRADLKTALKGKYAGDTLRLTVKRSGMTIKIDLVLGKK
jgi:membrane-associated protease RseP (regulator of RpoE activity)